VIFPPYRQPGLRIQGFAAKPAHYSPHPLAGHVRMIIDKLQGYLPVSVERQFLHDFQDQLQISHIAAMLVVYRFVVIASTIDT